MKAKVVGSVHIYARIRHNVNYVKQLKKEQLFATLSQQGEHGYR